MYVFTRSLAGLGLFAVLATSALAYRTLRWAGAAYLVFLGLLMIRSASLAPVAAPVPSTGNAFTQGIVTELLNPKTALFFLSFIPQFVDPKLGSLFAQFLLLGAITVVLNTTADLLVAFFAGPIANRLLASPRARRRQRQGTGAMMIGLGLYVFARES